MRESEPTGDYIWLRQSVTFTANGQTRTLEIAIPVRPGADATEVEALLAQAETGMARLSHALDARVVATLAPQSAIAAASPAALRSAPAAAQQVGAPVASGEREQVTAPTSSSTSSPAPSIREPAATRPAAATTREPAAAQPPAAPASAPARPASPAPAQPRPAPTRVTAPTPSPSSPGPSSTPAPARARTSEPLAATPAPAAGPELSRPEFLAAAAQLGLKPKDAMDRLGVRSLEGLNLREALESLRRQMLHSSGASTTPPAAPTSPAQTPATPPARTPPGRAEASRAASAPLPSRAPAYFEEEDDADFTFTVDEEGALDDDDDDDEDAGAPAGPAYEPAYGPEPDDFDLDDVPDFGPPPGRTGAPPSSASSSSRSSRAPTRPAPARSAAPSTPASTPTAPATPAASHAQELVAQMRAAAPGGTPSAQQRTAYRNIVVSELGEADARALVQGLWRVTPERLGPDQLEALISWGKQETFADDVPLVLAALEAERRAERERASGETGAAPSAGSSAARTRTGAAGSNGQGGTSGAGRTSRGDR